MKESNKTKEQLIEELRELRREKSTARNYLDIAGVILVVIGSDKKVSLINKKGCDVLGYSEKEVLGRNWFSNFLPKRSSKDVETVFKRLMAGEIEAGEYHENPVLTRSGEERIIRWHNAVLRDDAGRITGALSSGEDVTELKKAEDGLKKYETLCANAKDLVYICDREGKILFVNKVFQDMTGYSPEEFTGRPFAPLFDEENLKKAMDIYSMTLQGENAVAEIAFKDTGIICEYKNIPLKNDRGEITGVIGTARDLTERIAEEMEIRKLSRAVEQSPSLIIITDKEGNIEYVNPKFTETTGYTPEEVIAQNPRILKSGEKPPGEYKELWETITSGKEWRGEFHNKKKNEEMYWASASISPIFDDEGNITGFIGIQEDITEKKKVEDELRRYAHIVSVSSEHMSFLDTDYIYRAVNDAYLEAHNRKREEIVGRSVAELLGEDVFDNLVKERLDRALAGEEVRYESWFDFKGTGKRRMEVTYYPFFDDKDSVEGIVVNSRDVTERKMAEEKLKEKERNMRLFMQSTNDCIWNWDMVANNVERSVGFERKFGYNAQDIHPGIEWWADRLDPDDRERVWQTFNSAVAGGQRTCGYEYRFRRKDGSYATIEDNVCLIYDGKGKVVRSLGAMTDITSRKEAEENIKKAKEAAEASSRIKSDFLANMSHEIRTPLCSILGMSDLLSETPLNKEQSEYVKTSIKAGNDLLQLINEILDFSKIEAGTMALETVDFNIDETILNVATEIGKRAWDKGLQFMYNISPEVPANLSGAPDHLIRIIKNLLENAIKFTDTGEVRLEVKLGTKAKGTEKIELFFAVRDTGIGIPEDKIGAIFESFAQADTSSTRRHGGTGLGLAISKKLVENMGGRIWVESSSGRGSSFFFTTGFNCKQERKEQKKIAGTDIRGVRILLVDDNESYRNAAGSVLSARGGDVVLAESGKTGIRELQRAKKSGHPFDVIFIDYLMEGMNGIEMAERMRKMCLDHKETDVYILSAYGKYYHSPDVKPSGVNGFIMKPGRMADLADIISNAAEEKSQEAETETIADKRRLRVLIVEDSEDNRLLFQLFVKDTPYIVEFAENGQAGVEKFRSYIYNLVIMDMQMPVMDGYAATKAIREFEKETGREATPIIALTAHAFKEDKEKCLAAGCDQHVSKPIKKTALLEMIYRYANA